jgi:fructan beta-fructosidase
MKPTFLTLLTAMLLAPLIPLHAADAPQTAVATNVTRELVVEKKLLHFPVKNGAAKRAVVVSVDGKEVRRFDIELADGSADWWAPLDVGAWVGKTLSVGANSLPAGSQALASLRQSDVLLDAENLYREPLRPQFHFSPRRGWVGDPNGLVFYKGVYHLFFQYNPYAVKWGNMHWGHAVSKDLVHWRELPITLYPPKLGDHPYSGGAVVDRENTAGFKNGPEDPIVIVFPSTKRGICLTYSTDGGQTFTEFSGNPVCKGQGGDPRVVWHEPTRQWVMIACKILKFDPSLPPGKPNWKAKAKCGFEFFTSPDLKNWTRQSGIEDYWECPELFELPVDGDRQHTKWVVYANQTPSLISRGEEHFGRYAIGSFDGKRFTAEQEKIRFNYGDAYAAAQTYNGIPAADGRRINVGCAFHTRMPGMPFQQMMNFPTELSLRTTEDGPRLFAWPIREIASLYAATREFSKTSLSPEGTVLPGVEAGLLDISAEFSVGAATEEVGLKVRGVDITFDAKNGLLKCADRTAPLKPVNGTIKFRLLLDRVSLEIFANEGRVYMPMAMLPKDEERAVAVFAKGDGVRLTALTVHTLKSAWEHDTGTKP